MWWIRGLRNPTRSFGRNTRRSRTFSRSAVGTIRTIVRMRWPYWRLYNGLASKKSIKQAASEYKICKCFFPSLLCLALMARAVKLLFSLKLVFVEWSTCVKMRHTVVLLFDQKSSSLPLLLCSSAKKMSRTFVVGQRVRGFTCPTTTKSTKIMQQKNRERRPRKCEGDTQVNMQHDMKQQKKL